MQWFIAIIVNALVGKLLDWARDEINAHKIKKAGKEDIAAALEKAKQAKTPEEQEKASEEFIRNTGTRK